MPAEHPDRIDYRALRQQVKQQRRGRRTVRHQICLDTALLDEWTDLKDQERRETVASIDREPGKPDPTLRHGQLSTGDKLQDLEERIAAASVVAIFVVPDAEVQARRNTLWDEVRATDDAKKINDHAIAAARAVVVESFDHFEDLDGGRIPDDQYGVEDLKDLIAEWTQGQVFAVSGKITSRSAEAPELPLYERR